jgi:hypothetical protein
MLCEEKSRLLDACDTVTDRQVKAVRSLSAVAAKYNRRAFRDALADAEQARQEWRRQDWRCNCIQKLIAADPYPSITTDTRSNAKRFFRIAWI